MNGMVFVSVVAGTAFGCAVMALIRVRSLEIIVDRLSHTKVDDTTQ